MKEPTGLESARRKAAAYSHNVKKTVELLNEASVKAEKEKTKVEKVWNELGMLIKMIRAWTRGEYKEMPTRTIITGLAALLYFVNPFDVIPDFIIGIGYLDDVTIISFVFNSLRKDVQHFAEWDKLTRNEEDFISI